jgi:L-malate glycosyltransferase
MAVYISILYLSKAFVPHKKPDKKSGFEIILTGIFYSDNWIKCHLIPLAQSKNCKRIRMVAETRVPNIPKVEAVYPSARLSTIFGTDIARLLTFVWTCLKYRPDFVGGFHLLVNGLVALIISHVIGAKSIYFCGGGPREVEGGGYRTENRIFGKLQGPNMFIENILLKTVKSFDVIIVMGKKAKEFFVDKHIKSKIWIVPGGFDGIKFNNNETSPTRDFILVGRLSEIKRVDVFLRTISLLKAKKEDISATIVGDGPIRLELERLSSELKIGENVEFVGHQANVEEYLKTAKVFVLTSDSEGLSQAMMEAMLCGLPAVVSDVGDLSDIVNNGINGYLVPNRKPEDFAEYIDKILSNPEALRNFSRAARNTALKYEIENVANVWSGILENSCG